MTYYNVVIPFQDVKVFNDRNEAINYANTHNGYIEKIEPDNISGYIIKEIISKDNYYEVVFHGETYNAWKKYHHDIVDPFSTIKEINEAISEIIKRNEYETNKLHIVDEYTRFYSAIPLSKTIDILPLYNVKTVMLK